VFLIRVGFKLHDGGPPGPDLMNTGEKKEKKIVLALKFRSMSLI